MRFILIILVILVSSCKITNLSAESLKSSEQRLTKKINQWAASKVPDILIDFNSGMPFLNNHTPTFIPPSDFPTICKKIELAVQGINTKAIENKNNMVKLKKFNNIILKTLDDFSETQLWVNNVFAKHADDFHNLVLSQERLSVGSGGVYSTANLSSYCMSNNINKRDCKSEPYNKNGNVIATTILYRYLIDNNQKYKEYFHWLNQEKKTLSKIANNITQKGIEFEKKMFLKNASLNGCKKISNFNFLNNALLSSQIGNGNFRQDKTSIYDLGYFKILQSQSDAVLLSTTSSNHFNAPPIFAITSKIYTDGYIFQPGEQFVCAAGIKEYVSVLGVSKRINLFRTIQDDNKYYFFKVKNN